MDGSFFYQLGYFVPFGALLLTTHKRIDVALPCWLLFQYAYTAADVLPSSRWADQVQINGSKLVAPTSSNSSTRAGH
jgi:hypothetical protein